MNKQGETSKQLWQKENPNINFDREAGCRDYEFANSGIQMHCYSKKCSDCWNVTINEEGNVE